MKAILASFHIFQSKTEPAMEKFRLLLLAAFVGLLPFPMEWSTIALFLAGLATLPYINRKKLGRIPRQFWIFQLVFYLSLAGYAFSSDLFRAGYLIERQLALLIFPLLLPMAIDLSRLQVQRLLWVLTATCCCSLLYLFVAAGLRLQQQQLPLSSLLTQDFLNHRFSAPLGIHAGYLSLYIALAVIFLLEQFTSPKSSSLRLLYGTLLLLCCSGLFFLAARNTMIATALVAGIIFPWYYVRNKLSYFGSGLLLLVLLLLVLSRSDYFHDRFYSELMYDIEATKTMPDTEQAEPRMKRWRAALPIIAERPWFGHGTGDEVLLLKQAYLDNQLMTSYKLNFNAHNEYIAILIRHGITGLLILLAMFGYLFRLAIRHKNFVYTGFLFTFMIGLITENLLDANKGIFYFACFNTLLGYNLLLNGLKKKA